MSLSQRTKGMRAERNENPVRRIIPGNPYFSGRDTAQVDRRKPGPATPILAPAPNKYGAKRSWSALCNREFDSMAEMRRGEELTWLEKAGEITDLVFQPAWELCGDKHHKARFTGDFMYSEKGKVVVEDMKGVVTEAARVRMKWLWAKYNIDVKVIRPPPSR